VTQAAGLDQPGDHQQAGRGNRTASAANSLVAVGYFQNDASRDTRCQQSSHTQQPARGIFCEGAMVKHRSGVGMSMKKGEQRNLHNGKALRRDVTEISVTRARTDIAIPNSTPGKGNPPFGSEIDGIAYPALSQQINTGSDRARYNLPLSRLPR